MLWEGMRGWGSSLRVESGLTAGHLLSLSIAFSYILRWAQGRTFSVSLEVKTLSETLLSIARMPFPPHLDMEGFYVMVSRARRCLV